ncbi:methyltransferase domain-containing protein [Microbaculum marinum]|uniref:Methyltransferase domain-containing protein n=1 Tax=Microbaculum marinum TaxID=1764581 RepID=A0AAW9R9S3_9HYPH
MFVDVVDLRGFYGSGLGQVARRLLVRRLRGLWPDLSDMSVVGLGYAGPYLGIFREEAERTLAFMPAAQGVVNWPSDGPSAATLVGEANLPLGDGTVDRLLLVHCLEMSEQPRELLRECWRVLAPGGRLAVIVPNRRGLWARFEHTPFGHGRPFSRSQLVRLLRDALFTPNAWGEALWVPPFRGRFMIRSAAAWERVGTVIKAMPPGMLFVEATKQLYSAIPAKEARRSRVLVPSLAGEPVPSRRVQRMSVRNDARTG